MMKVSIVQPDLATGSTYSFEFFSSANELDVISEQYVIDGPIAIAGTLVYTGTCYRIEGSVHFKKTFQCDRCLEMFTRKQMLSFVEEYQKDGAGNSKDDMMIISGDFIDITELIRETILLSQPLNHICSSDCRGLCIKCGANLNEAECGCDRHIIDPRLVALQKLLNKQ